MNDNYAFGTKRGDGRTRGNDPQRSASDVKTKFSPTILTGSQSHNQSNVHMLTSTKKNIANEKPEPLECEFSVRDKSVERYLQIERF